MGIINKLNQLTRMKFAAFALIATVSAIRLDAPNDSYKAKSDSLAAALDAVATQQKFAADHLAMHTANMDTAEAECQALKSHVRKARSDQEAGGNQYPAFKTYEAKK